MNPDYFCQMRVLLCAATEFEIKPTIDCIHKNAVNDIDILITGIGLASATYHLTKAMHTVKPGFILQAGIAGCFDKNLSLGKTVVIENEIIGDLGVQENEKFNSLFDLKLLNQNDFPWKNGKLPNNIELLNQTGLPIVDGVTVNEISTNKKKISFYKNQLNAGIESMEGAALHYVALMEKIPFLQLRSLSNFVGERNKIKWIIPEAIANLNRELQKILSKF